MKRRSLSSILIAVAAAAFLPLRSDGDQATCCTATTSLASTINNPVTGDEAFFRLPTGPANVMLLLDTSGSMSEFPQCGDYTWDQSTALATCKSPNLALTAPDGSSTYTTFTGTCAPSTSGAPALRWMEQVVPQTAYADQGQTNSLLTDCPPWGNGGTGCGTKVCSGSGCLFDATAYYTYGDWQPNDSSASGTAAYYPTTTRRQLDGHAATTTEPTAPCVALDASGNVITDYNTHLPVSLGSACTQCMQDHGFYIYKVSYVTGFTTKKGVTTPNVTTVTKPLFRGTFLNANPPKFVAARKVVKSLAWMDRGDTGDRLKLDQVRLGLTVVADSQSKPQQARLIVPLGPDKGGAYPFSFDGYRQARQYILSDLNYDTSVYTTDGNALAGDRSNLLIDGSTISGGFFNPASGGTPLGSALFNVGQYFTSTGTYNLAFGTTGCKNASGSAVSCQVSAFNETSSGDVHAAWVTNTNNTQCSICWGCSNSSIIVITDGSPNNEITFPSTITGYDNNGYNAATNCGTASCSYCPTLNCPPDTQSTVSPCNCIEPVDSKAAVMPRVSSWLHNNDLRADSVMSGKQALTIHTIGFNDPGTLDPRANDILQATAHMGGGTPQVASTATALANAVYNAVSMVIPREESFSAASANSLQTVQTTASQAFLTRFKPNQTITWEGHVYEAFLFDEFLNGCDPSKSTQPIVSCGQATTKQVSADFDGDGKCTGVFLVDLDCDEIAEDPSTGNFVKKGQATAANLPWDAGQVLSYETFPGPYPPAGANSHYRSADETATNARNIFTWVGGSKVALTSANASTLKPYMNISATWCTSFLNRIGVSGGTDPTLECAKEVIYFVRGWDVLDQDSDGCAGPGKTNASTCQRGAKGEERDRSSDSGSSPFFWKLGDISHSSPAVLQAPIDEIRCDTGYEKQCVATLHSPAVLRNQTPMPSSGDSYQAYRTANISRPRVVLVGGNDGMLHAFNAGNALTGSDPDITGSYPYDNGTGEEMWAFIPPDMLPRLKDMVDAHQYMVDGSVMLRDVWVDGSAVANGTTTNVAISGKDGVKQAAEFHTVAIFGRRAGGNEYSALDVTDPTKPTLLWNFPQGCGDDARFMGQSWADFAPRPPPIVPIKIKSTTDARGFEERWVAMINGGYDPTLTRGRAVFFVDAWTGATLWRFTDDDFKANMGYDGSGPSMFPVPGAVAPVDVGDPSKQTFDQDGFFDTAVWGDMGGNVWVARFETPGAIDSTTGRVPSTGTAAGSWYAARTFEQRRSSGDTQNVSGRNEFFFMPATAFDPASHTLHTYLGSGNREQIMSQTAACGADNLLACCQAGCTTVTATTTENFGGCSRSDTFSCVNGVLTHTDSNSCSTSSAATCASGTNYTSNVTLHFVCPGAGTVADATGSVSCDGSGLCSITPVGAKTVSSTSFTAPSHNRFYGIWAYGRDPAKLFEDRATSRTFDANRFTDVAYTGCTGPTNGTCSLVQTTQARVTFATSNPQLTTTSCADSSTKCTATVDDAGWFYEYGDRCPLSSCSSTPPWTDEKTGAGANVVLGCTAWAGFRPVGMTTSTDPCSGSLGTPASYGYSADYITGAPTSTCGYASGTTSYIASQRSLTAPPSGATVRVDVRKDGQIGYSMLRLDPGAPPSSTTLGTHAAAGSPVYWLEVPRDLHACRHVVSPSGTFACE